MNTAKALYDGTIKTFHNFEKGFDYSTSIEEIEKACQCFAKNIVSHEGKLYIVMPEEFSEEIGMSAILASSQDNDPRIIGYKVMQKVTHALLQMSNG